MRILAPMSLRLFSLMLVLAPHAGLACESPGRRVIALGGAVTEIIFALGEGDRLVGVDTTSRYPEIATTLPDVGYYRQLGAEGLLSLAPDLILADPGAGPPAALRQVASAGVCIVEVTDGGSAAAVGERVRDVAAALKVEDKGTVLADRLDARFAELDAAVTAGADRPKVLFLLSLAGDTPLAAGSDTDADAIIRLAGGVNAVAFKGYKPLSPEAAAAAAPDALLMMAHVVDEAGGASHVLGLPQIRLTPAGRAGRLIAMDGLLLLGFGPRTPDAIAELAARLRQPQ